MSMLTNGAVTFFDQSPFREEIERILAITKSEYSGKSLEELRDICANHAVMVAAQEIALDNIVTGCNAIEENQKILAQVLQKLISAQPVPGLLLQALHVLIKPF